ncbi:hypothetical protein MNBD_GAMMA11-2274 [hydrothermal vent metagenome]|uniref:DUF4124 domain-containing protein n=1 Tax=hydrothermal vent metagenome TaxID=652676 RepID=A0A3B0X9Q2_9ZZZZ
MAINQANIIRLTQQVLFTTVFLCSTLSYAGIYKWTDEQGNVHYGERRPTNATSEKMDVQRYAPESTSTYNRPGTQKGAKDASAGANREKPADAPVDEKKPETRAEKKKRLETCAKAQKSLKTMEEVGRIRAVDKEGNTTFLSQQQKEERMRQSREMLSKHCK